MNLGMLDIAEVGGIVVVVYLIAQAVKQTSIDTKWIPTICGALGGILGFVGFITNVPGFPATDWLSAIVTGIVSGFAATGINQVYKQLTGTACAWNPSDGESEDK